jgi:hypothetical protein
MVFVDQIGNDGVTIADRCAVILNVRQLSARRGAGVENMLVTKRYFGEFEKRESLEPYGLLSATRNSSG